MVVMRAVEPDSHKDSSLADMTGGSQESQLTNRGGAEPRSPDDMSSPRFRASAVRSENWRNPAQGTSVLFGADVGISLDLDQHVGIDQALDLHHRRRRPDGAEDLAVRAADVFPLRDVEHVDARAHDVL